MSGLRRFWERVRALRDKHRLDVEHDAEVAAHLEMATEENLRRGLPAGEARRQAMARFGGVTQAREQQRVARGLPGLEILLQDLKYSLRTLGRERGFTAAAVLVLALGIGANVAVFSVVNTLLLRPLPFEKSQQLVWIAPPPAKCGMSCATYSTDAYDEFRVGSRAYQDVTGYFAFSTPDNLSVNVSGEPVPATGIDVVANFFQVLGVQAAMGRLFTAEDARHGAPPVILLTNAWWKRQFNGDPNIVGKAFDINGKQTTVIGVLPASFDFGAVFSPGAKIDALTPLDLYGPPRDWGNILTMIGRLKPGVTLEQAQDDARRVAPTMCWNNKRPTTCGVYRNRVVPVQLKEYVSGRLHRALLTLWGAVGMILLIACVNLSNLLLARASARSKEFALRGALGASRMRIARQLLTESFVLAGAGAALGLALAWVLLAWLAQQGSIALPLLNTLHIDGAALGWTVLIAVMAAVFFGMAPGLRMAGSNLQQGLKDAGPGLGQSRRHERLRSALVVTEIGLACMLLVGAGLLLRSFMKVLDVDLGFEPSRVAAMKVDFSYSAQTADEGVQKLKNGYQEILARVSALPGVEAAGFSDFLPLGQNRSWGTPIPKGIVVPREMPAGPLVYVISPGYLRAMGTPLRGRDFTWDDGLHSEQVVIISASYASYVEKLAGWPAGSAVGKIISNGGDSLRIAGVADDVHAESTENVGGWQIYYPTTQKAPVGTELVVRSKMTPDALAGSVLQALRELNPKQTAEEFRPMQMLVDRANSPRRFFMLLVGAFAALGLLLAAVGIYGVISYAVTRRTQEIGIRMALGASMGRVQADVLRNTLRLAAVGIVLGTIVSLGLARLIAALLFDTSPWDGATYAGMVILLTVVALVSGYLPARRASRIDPLTALREE